jgi:hypothetical protein
MKARPLPTFSLELLNNHWDSGVEDTWAYEYGNRAHNIISEAWHRALEFCFGFDFFFSVFFFCFILLGNNTSSQQTEEVHNLPNGTGSGIMVYLSIKMLHLSCSFYLFLHF